jgi:chitinase
VLDLIAAGYVFLSEQDPFDLLNAPLQHLTHLIVSFADVSPGLTAVWGPRCDPVALRERFPGLKVLLAVGGWTWSGRFSDAAFTPSSRRAFADSALVLMERHGFDGFDVDWEFPVIGGLAENLRRPEDGQDFTHLLEDLRRTFDGAEGRLGRHLLLTVATGANRPQVEALETESFHRFVDWMNLMTYDFHGSWNPAPGDNSSLADTEASVQLHLDRGFPAAKIVVGTPLYAHQWVWAGAWVAGAVVLWNQAQAWRTEENFVWDEARGASRLEEPNRVVTWDSEEALAAKVALVRRLGLGGLMTWQITGDPEGLQLARLRLPSP